MQLWRAEGTIKMGMYDSERDIVVEFPGYFACCLKCGKEGLKKKMVTISAKHRTYGNFKTIGHLCEECYAKMLEENEWEEKS